MGHYKGGDLRVTGFRTEGDTFFAVAWLPYQIGVRTISISGTVCKSGETSILTITNGGGAIPEGLQFLLPEPDATGDLVK